MQTMEHPPWRAQYIAYKRLKKLLKCVVGEISTKQSVSAGSGAEELHAQHARVEGAFVTALLQELAKVNAFHALVSDACHKRMVHLSDVAEDALCRSSRAHQVWSN
jgi:SPX domain protein involved in polyphosphate accumulation